MRIVKDNKWLFMFAGFLICICLCFNLTSMLLPSANAAAGTDESFVSMSNAAAAYFNECTSASGQGDRYNFKSINGLSAMGSGTSGTSFGRHGAFLGYLGDSKVSGVTDASGSNATIYNVEALDNSRIGYLFNNNTYGLPSEIARLRNQSAMNPFQAYVYYGHALSLCGFDEVGLNTDGTSGARTIVGTLMMALYIASLGVSTFFELVLTILIYANPFRLFIDVDLGVTATEIMNNKLTTTGHTGSDIQSAIVAGIATIQGYTRSFYNMLQNMSLLVLMPLFLGFALFNWLVINRGGNFWKSAKGFIIRMVFLVLGVPMMFACYDAALQTMKGTLTVDNNFGTEVVLSTFCDFESWANNYNLSLPAGTDIRYNYENRELDSQTIIMLRSYCHNINSMSLSLNASSLNVSYTRAGEALSDYDTMLLNASSGSQLKNSTIDAATLSNTLDILRRYSTGTKFEAGRYASLCKLYMPTNNSGNASAYRILTASSMTPGDFDIERAATDAGHNYGQVDGTNDIVLNKSQTQTLTRNRFSYEYWPADGGHVGSTPNGGSQVRNPWYSDGSLLFVVGSTQNVAGGQIPNHFDILRFWSTNGGRYGLSMMSMYNYLDTQFSETGAYVQSSGISTVSDTDKWYHYSVTSVGSGLMQIFYIIDAMAIMGCLSIVGYGYALSLLFANIKALFQMIPKVFKGMFGSMNGIAASVVMMFALICNVIFTILLYTLAIDIIRAIYGIVEAPLAILFDSYGVFNSIGSILIPAVGLISIYVVLYVTRVLLRWRKAVVQSTTEACTHLVNRFLGTQVGTPDLSAPADGLGGKILSGAGAVGSLALAGQAGAFSGLAGEGSKLADNSGLAETRNRLNDAIDNIRDGFESDGAPGALSAMGIGGTAAEASDPLSYSKGGNSSTSVAEGKYGVSNGGENPNVANRNAMERAFANGQIVPAEGVDGSKFSSMDGEGLASAYANGELVAADDNMQDSYASIAANAKAEGEAARLAGYGGKEESHGAGINANSMRSLVDAGAVVPSDKGLPEGKSLSTMTEAELSEAYAGGYLTSTDSASGSIAGSISARENATAMEGAYASGKLIANPDVQRASDAKAFSDMSGVELAQAYQNGELVTSSTQDVDVYDNISSNVIRHANQGPKTIEQSAGDYVAMEQGSYLDSKSANVAVGGGGVTTVQGAGGSVFVEQGPTMVQSVGGAGAVMAGAAGVMGASAFGNMNGGSQFVDGGTQMVTVGGTTYVQAPESNTYVPNLGGGGTHVLNEKGENLVISRGQSVYRVASDNPSQVIGEGGHRYRLDAHGDEYQVMKNSEYVMRNNTRYTIDDSGIPHEVYSTGGHSAGGSGSPRVSQGSSQRWTPVASNGVKTIGGTNAKNNK